MTRGHRLKKLRENFGPKATQDIIETLSGVSRAMISKAEGDKIEWKSADVLKGLARAFSMTVEEFELYLDGDPGMPIERALAKARPRIMKAIAEAGADENLRGIARHAAKLADVDDEMAPAVAEILIVFLRRHGQDTPIAEVVTQAREFAAELQDKLTRGSGSHKSRPPSGRKGR